MTTAVYELLLDAMDNRYEGSVTRLADALGVPVQSASKWVHEDERRRTNPGPESCEKIAAGLNLDADYVLQLAGHRKARLDAAAQVSALRQSARAEADGWISVVGEQYEQLFWDDVRNHVRSTIALIQQIQSAVSEPGDTAVKQAVSQRSKAGRKPQDGAKGPLRGGQHAAHDLLTGSSGRRRPANQLLAA